MYIRIKEHTTKTKKAEPCFCNDEYGKKCDVQKQVGRSFQNNRLTALFVIAKNKWILFLWIKTNFLQHNVIKIHIIKKGGVFFGNQKTKTKNKAESHCFGWAGRNRKKYDRFGIW